MRETVLLDIAHVGVFHGDFLQRFFIIHASENNQMDIFFGVFAALQQNLERLDEIVETLDGGVYLVGSECENVWRLDQKPRTAILRFEKLETVEIDDVGNHVDRKSSREQTLVGKSFQPCADSHKMDLRLCV